MKIVLSESVYECNTAGLKATADAVATAINNGYRPIKIDGCVPTRRGIVDRLIKRVKWFFVWLMAERKFACGDVVFIPHSPSFLCRQSGRKFLARLKKKGVRFIYLVHDIDGIRLAEGEERIRRLVSEIKAMEIYDVLIANTTAIRDLLIEYGIGKDRIVVSGIWDYLLVEERLVAKRYSGKHCVCFAGNLMAKKSSWLTHMKDFDGITWNLYGPNYEGLALNMKYCGSFSAEKLPSKLEGAWGIVWDGVSICSCLGTWGEYERYNNPHKLSLYIVAGKPVIVWSEAAIADVVRRCGIGICVSSLQGLRSAIDCVSAEEYKRMKLACEMLAKKLRKGFFMKEALMRSEEIISKA